MAAAPPVFFGDDAGNAYRIDAVTGQLIWKVRADAHATAMIAGTPVLHEGKLYVPVASTEWLAVADPDQECCTFRGGVAALDAPAVGASLLAFVVVYFTVFGIGVWFILKLMGKAPHGGDSGIKGEIDGPIRTAGITPGPTQNPGGEETLPTHAPGEKEPV